MGVCKGFVVSSGQECCLVAKIGNLGSTEPWGEGGKSSREVLDGFGGVYDNLFEMDVEDLSSAFEIRQIDFHCPIESAWPDECGIE